MYMANQPRSRNDLPMEEVGKRHQQPHGVAERAEEYASVRACVLRMDTAWSAFLECSEIQKAASAVWMTCWTAPGRARHG